MVYMIRNSHNNFINIMLFESAHSYARSSIPCAFEHAQNSFLF